jgi:hypothetical protein
MRQPDGTTKQAIQNGKRHAARILKRREEALRKRATALRQRGISVAPARTTLARRGGAPANAGTLVAEGDSWFDYPLSDVLKTLEDNHGYEVESVAHAGDIVEDMAYTDQLEAFASRLEKLIRHSVTPKAILLSGGGNDVAGTEFAALLNHSDAPTRGLNQRIVDGLINERLREAYIRILTTITGLCRGKLGRPVPILLHGYDYPIPDGRGFAGGFWFLPGPWLEPGFRRKGYMDMPERTAITASLIDRFNEMLRKVTQTQGFAHVTFVDLRGTLPRGAEYKKWWANELHPTARGFQKVTDEFVKALDALA